MVLFSVVLITVFIAVAYGRQPVYFSDPNLKAAVEKTLHTRAPNAADMLGLTELYAAKQGIADLAGLEYARNLRIIRLEHNQISDISVLSGLTALEFVDLAHNRIKSVPELSKLKELTWLILYNNEFDDIPAARKQIGLKLAAVVMYEGNRDPNITPPPLETAIVRSDNDYVFTEPYDEKTDKLLKLPDPVRESMCQVTLKKFLNTFYEGIEPQKYSELFGPVFHIRIPKYQCLRLYVYVMKGIGTLSDTFCLILYNSRTDEATAKPVCFSGRWMYGNWPWIPIKKPFVDFNDLNLDGKPEIVFKERIHNGTELNAIVHHFLRVGSDLSLTPIFRLEKRSYHHSFNDRFVTAKPGYIIRTIEKQKTNRILVRVSVSEDPFKEGKMKVGHVVLESVNASAPFEVEEKVIYLKEEDVGRWYGTYAKLLLHTWLSPYKQK
jgi:hypothetical protein